MGLTGPLGADAIEAARARLLPLMAAGPAHSRAAALLWQPDSTAALVALALETQDAAVIALALARCQRSGAPEACKRLSPRDWVRVDSRNAAAWFLLANTPSANPPATDAEISAGLRQSTQFKQHRGHMAQAVLAAAPADVPTYVQMGLVIEATGIEAALPDAVFASAIKHCKPPGTLSAESLVDCAHVAEVMVARGDTVGVRMLGTSLGERAGWPPTRVAAIERDTAEVTKMQADAFSQPQPWGCGSVEPMLTVARNRVVMGELSAWRSRFFAPSAPAAAPGR